MSTIRRDFKASPHRTGAETWVAITRLLAPKEGSAAQKELLSVAGVAGQIISTESVKDYPIISAGSGPRVRIYCIYNEDALDDENTNETALAFDATSKDWLVSIPAEPEDIDWGQAELSKLSKRITVREKTEPVDVEEQEPSFSGLKLDSEEFLKQ